MYISITFASKQPVNTAHQEKKTGWKGIRVGSLLVLTNISKYAHTFT